MTKIGIASQLVDRNATVVTVVISDLLKEVDDYAGDVIDWWDLGVVGSQRRECVICVTIQTQIRSLNLILDQSC